MSDQWYYTHAGATHGPVSGLQLSALIETDGLAPDDLIWPAGVAPTHAVRADAALAFPPSAPVRPEDFQPAPPPPPEWLRELAEAFSAGGEVASLPPPSPASWLADVRLAEQARRPGDAVRGATPPPVEPKTAAVPNPSPPPPPAKAPPPPADPLHELTVKVFSGFLVGPLIARGRTGNVFRARHVNGNADVALKVFWPRADKDDAATDRFVRFLQTLAPLRHPNLVTLFGAGEAGKNCWISMELIEGESLNQVIDRLGVAGQLDWRNAFRVGYELARALEFTHGRGVIHGNITPLNVLIRSADQAIKLGDLAQSGALEGAPAEDAARPGPIVADVRYMSPERTGGFARVDDRSDVYSLGALLYTLVTGRPPLDGGSPEATIHLIRTKAPERPKKFQMSLPDLFEGTVLKMLAKQPEDRHQSAAELITDLKRVAKFSGIKL